MIFLEILEPLSSYCAIQIFKEFTSNSKYGIGPLDITAKTSSKCRIITIVLARPVGIIHGTLVYLLICLSIFISFMSNQKLYWPPNYACVLNRSSIDDDDRDDDDDDGGGNDGVKNN